MFLLVFVVLLGTVVTVNSDKPEVEMHSDIVNVGAETGRHMMLTCRARGFIISDIILNIKKNRCVLTKEDGVNTTGVRTHDKTYWRRDYVIILKSEVSHYSCEVIHAASRFRVEKVWDEMIRPPSDSGSKFMERNPPEVVMFTENSKVQTNIILTCLVSGFYPNNIIMNMKRNGRILTREDGVESSRVCSNEDDTFQRRDYVEIKKSDKSDYSCEVIHDASGSRVEKVWERRLPPNPGGAAGKTGAIFGGVVVVLLLFLVVVLVVLKKRGILVPFVRCMIARFSGGAPAAATPSGGNGVKVPLLNGGAPAPAAPTVVVVAPPPGGDVNIPLMVGTKGSKTSVNSNNSSDSGVPGSQPGGSGSDSGSSSSQSGFSTSSAVGASMAAVSCSVDSGIRRRIS